MIPVSKPVDDYQVVKSDGSGFHDIVKMTVTHITELSYVGDLYDAEDNCIATDRCFSFDDSIIPLLSKGEIKLVTGQIPDNTWSVDEIKLYLDNVGIDHENVTEIPDLLALLEPIDETIEEVI